MKLLKSLTRQRALLVLAALLLGALPSTASAEVYEKGKLTSYSQVSKEVRPGCYYRAHVVTLKAGTTYTIDLRSTDFDAYLVVTDDDGRCLAEDDDSGGGLDARIVLRASYTGEYIIYVTTYRQGETGSYSLLVRP